MPYYYTAAHAMDELGTSPSSTTDVLLLERETQEKLSLKTEQFQESLNEAGKPRTVEVLQPGLVLIRNFLPDAECEKLAKTALLMGSQEAGENGFYTRDAVVTAKTSQGGAAKDAEGVRHGDVSEDLEDDGGSKLKLNTGDPGRGRIYDAATRFPPRVTDRSRDAVELARSVDPSMPGHRCTHVLLNMYTTCDGLLWHRDIYENDGTSDHPVVNLCIGASCTFGYETDESEDSMEPKQQFLKLHSGDCLLFGGPSRLMKHAVIEVHLDQCPAWMDRENPVRFSFTYRDSPEVLGREEEFKYFRVKEHLVGQEDYDMKKPP